MHPGNTFQLLRWSIEIRNDVNKTLEQDQGFHFSESKTYILFTGRQHSLLRTALH